MEQPASFDQRLLSIPICDPELEHKWVLGPEVMRLPHMALEHLQLHAFDVARGKCCQVLAQQDPLGEQSVLCVLVCLQRFQDFLGLSDLQY